MDTNTSGALGIFGFILSSLGVVYAAINHKRIRCRCCGKDMDVSVDVDPTESAPPTNPKPIRREEEQEEEEDDDERKNDLNKV